MLDEGFLVGRVRLNPGEVLVITLPEGYSEELRQLAKHCAHRVKEANPGTPVLIMPPELGPDAIPREWTVERLRREAAAIQEMLAELEGREDG